MNISSIYNYTWDSFQLLSKFKSVKIYWLSVKFDCFESEKYFFTYSSVKSQVTDSISENLTDSDLESISSSFGVFSAMSARGNSSIPYLLLCALLFQIGARFFP